MPNLVDGFAGSKMTPRNEGFLKLTNTVWWFIGSYCARLFVAGSKCKQSRVNHHVRGPNDIEQLVDWTPFLKSKTLLLSKSGKSIKAKRSQTPHPLKIQAAKNWVNHWLPKAKFVPFLRRQFSGPELCHQHL